MLVDVATYQRVTKDTSSAASAVEAELADAQQLVDEHCKRTFEYATNLTETLDVSSQGIVYPKAMPVASVSSPANATLRLGGIYVGPLNFYGTIPLSPLPVQSTVTYAGGYKPYGTGDPSIPDVPVKLMRVICRIAWLALHPSIFPGVPAGAKSASVGDVAVSGDLSPFIVLDPSIQKDLRGFIRTNVGVGALS